MSTGLKQLESRPFFDPAKLWLDAETGFTIENWFNTRTTIQRQDSEKGKTAKKIIQLAVFILFTEAVFQLRASQKLTRRSLFQLVTKNKAAQGISIFLFIIVMMGDTEEQSTFFVTDPEQRGQRDVLSSSSGSSSDRNENNLYTIFLNDVRRVAPQILTQNGKLVNVARRRQQNARLARVKKPPEESGTVYGLRTLPNLFTALTNHLNQAAPPNIPVAVRDDNTEVLYRRSLLDARTTVNVQLAMVANAGQDVMSIVKRTNERRTITEQEEADLEEGLSITQKLLEEHLPPIIKELGEIPYTRSDTEARKMRKQVIASKITSDYGGYSTWRTNQKRWWDRYNTPRRRQKRPIKIQTASSR